MIKQFICTLVILTLILPLFGCSSEKPNENQNSSEISSKQTTESATVNETATVKPTAEIQSTESYDDKQARIQDELKQNLKVYMLYTDVVDFASAHIPSYIASEKNYDKATIVTFYLSRENLNTARNIETLSLRFAGESVKEYDSKGISKQTLLSMSTSKNDDGYIMCYAIPGEIDWSNTEIGFINRYDKFEKYNEVNQGSFDLIDDKLLDFNIIKHNGLYYQTMYIWEVHITHICYAFLPINSKIELLRMDSFAPYIDEDIKNDYSIDICSGQDHESKMNIQNGATIVDVISNAKYNAPDIRSKFGLIFGDYVLKANGEIVKNK